MAGQNWKKMTNDHDEKVHDVGFELHEDLGQDLLLTVASDSIVYPH
jgi:hypothetical protein